MKKQYEQPMAEKIDFNYKETIVASSTRIAKGGADNKSCYNQKHSSAENCNPKY